MDEEAASKALFVPIVYGSIALWLGKKASHTNVGEHTHKWSIYLRHAADADLSYAVARVEIMLHPSFANPVRGACACVDCVEPSAWSCVEPSAWSWEVVRDMMGREKTRVGVPVRRASCLASWRFAACVPPLARSSPPQGSLAALLAAPRSMRF